MKVGDLVKYNSSYSRITRPVCGIIIDVDKDFYQWIGNRQLAPSDYQDKLEVLWSDPEGIGTKTCEPASRLELVNESR